MPRRRPRWVPAVLGVSLLFLLEAVARVVTGPPPPPVSVYAIVEPGTTYFEVEGDKVSMPWQQPSIPERWSPHAEHRRIGVLGGSSVHGGSGILPYTQEFPALLAQKTGIEVLNLASPALDTHDHRRQVDELVALDFDTLILYAGHNDFGNAWFMQRYSGMGGTASALTRATFERSRIYWLLRALLAPVVFRSPPGVKPNQKDPIDSTAVLRDLRMNLRRMIWRCRSAGVELVLLTPASTRTRPPSTQACPASGPCAATLYTQALSLVNKDPEAATALFLEAADADPLPIAAPTSAVALFREVAATEGVTLVDAARDLPREGRLDLPADRLFMDPVHFTGAGHEAIATLLLGVIAK